MRLSGGIPGRITTISLITAGVSLAIGLGFIGLDLGKPMKGILIFFSPEFSSKLAWASWLYLVFFVCLAGYLFSQSKGLFVYLTGTAAIAFLLAEGMFFGGMVARASWNSWLTPLSFFTSAMAAGSAAVYAVGYMTQRTVMEAEGAELGKVLFWAIIVNAVLEGIHVTMGMAGGGEKAAAANGLLSSPAFWGFVVVGVATPLFMLKRSTPVCAGPAIMAFIGLAAYKYAFVRSGFGSEPLPGLAAAFQTPKMAVAYAPSAVEWAVAVGFLAGVVVIADFLLGKLLAPRQS